MSACSEKTLLATGGRPGIAASPKSVAARTESTPSAHRGSTTKIIWTIATTFVTYAIFLVQGIIVARLLGPEGRGEFGTCLYFPREILLYAGLLGGVEIIAASAARIKVDSIQLRRNAARLGLVTGLLTAVVAAGLATALLVFTDRLWLLPYALVAVLFVPLEHMQLTMGAVDRGSGNFRRYNLNRLFFACAFPALCLCAWGWTAMTGAANLNWLAILLVLWIVSRLVGLLPTIPAGQTRIATADGTPRGLSQDSASLDSETVPSVRRLLSDGKPYALSMLISETFERLDIFLVLALATLVDAGHYFVALPAAALLTIAPNALSLFTFNYGTQQTQPVRRSLAIRAMLVVAVFQIATGYLFSLVIGDLILFCFSDRFSASIPIVLLLIPAYCIKGFLQATDGYLKGRGRPGVGTAARLFSIAVMLAVVWIAWPTHGLFCIPVAAGTGQAVSMVIVSAAIFLERPRPVPPRIEGPPTARG